MIWCVEDDASIRDIEVYALRSAGFEARGFSDGESMWCALQQEDLPQLVILDVMLPGIDGVELLKKMKATPRFASIATIMATAKGSEYDKVLGLDLGADYYLTKPFGVMELLACVRAVLRRNTSAAKSDENALISAGDVSINLDEHRSFVGLNEIFLTYKEFEMLKLFLEHPGRTYTRQQFMEHVWETDFYGETRTVDMHIRTLRRKLGAAGSHIHTIRNVGYRWEA